MAGAPSVVLVVGARNSGKTAYARALVARARAANRRVAGFLSEGEWQGGRKVGFHLQDVAVPGRRMLLASVEPGRGLELAVGPYHLSRAAFARADAELRRAAGADLVCVDEVGPLEVRGGGFAPALGFLLEHHTGILLLTVRPSVVDAVLAMVGAARVVTTGAPGGAEVPA